MQKDKIIKSNLNKMLDRLSELQVLNKETEKLLKKDITFINGDTLWCVFEDIKESIYKYLEE